MDALMFGFLNRFFRPRPLQIPAELTAQRLPLGPNCERVARWFLETQHSMTCLEQNAKTHLSKTGGRVSGEIDLIMVLNDERQTIVFVEVRSRAKNWDEFGTPLSAISAAKRLTSATRPGSGFGRMRSRSPGPFVLMWWG